MTPNHFNSKIPYSSIAAATKCLAYTYSPKVTAEYLGINKTHVYRAYKRDYTPTYKEALYKKGIVERPPKRRRAAVDVPTDYTEEMAEVYRLMHQAYVHVADAQIRAMFKEGE